jgi:hypothetical protein
MRRPAPDVLARQDQALALLREVYPLTLTTREIAKRVWVVTKGRWEPECGYEDRGDGWLVKRRWNTGCRNHCPRIWVPYPNQPRPDSQGCRQGLLRLERKGLVERLDLSDTGIRHTHWRATDET